MSLLKMANSELVNQEIVKLQRVSSPVGEGQLHELILAHAERTGSPKANNFGQLGGFLA